MFDGLRGREPAAAARVSPTTDLTRAVTAKAKRLNNKTPIDYPNGVCTGLELVMHPKLLYSDARLPCETHCVGNSTLPGRTWTYGLESASERKNSALVRRVGKRLQFRRVLN